MESNSTSPGTVADKESLEKPLSPILNKKRYRRKIPLDRQQSKILKVAVENCSNLEYTKCMFKSAGGKNISISENKIKEYKTLFEDILNDNRAESVSKLDKFTMKCKEQQQTVDYNKCASGDVTDGSHNNLNMLYENKKFPISKSTFESEDSMNPNVMKIFLNNTATTESSKESFEKKILQEMKNAYYNNCKEGKEEFKDSQMNYNETSESNSTLACEIENLQCLLDLKLDKQKQFDALQRDIVHLSNMKEAYRLSATSRDVETGTSVSQCSFSDSNYMKSQTSKMSVGFPGFTIEELQQTERMFEQYNLEAAEYKNRIKMHKPERWKKHKFHKHCKAVDGSFVSGEVSETKESSIKRKVKKHKNVCNKSVDKYQKNEYSIIPNSVKMREGSANTSDNRKSLSNSISVSSNNHVQICIGTKRIKINIKSENGSSIRTQVKDNNATTKVESDLQNNVGKHEDNKNKSSSENGGQLKKSEAPNRFSLASGKHVDICKDKFDEAYNMFIDTNNASHGTVKSPDGKKMVGFQSASGKEMRLPKEKMDLAYAVLMDNEEKLEQNPNVKKVCGFQSASGKKMDVPKEKMNLAYAMLTDNEENVGSIQSPNVKKLYGFQSVSGKKLDVPKEKMDLAYIMLMDNKKNVGSIQSPNVKKVCGFQSASGKKVDVPKEKMDLASAMLMDNEENTGAVESLNVKKVCGFQSASGNNVDIPKEKIDLAYAILMDDEVNIESVRCPEIPKISNIQSAPGKKIKIDLANAMLMDNESNIATIESQNAKKKCGFLSASGKKMNVPKEKFDLAYSMLIDNELQPFQSNDLKVDSKVVNKKKLDEAYNIIKETNVSNPLHKNPDFNHPYSNVGFQLGSGKVVDISKDKIDRAHSLLMDGDSEMNDLDIEQSMREFTFASGNKMDISKSKIEQAYNMLMDKNVVESEGCESMGKEKGDYISENTLKFNSAHGKTAHELIVDAVNTYDSAIEKVSSQITPLKKIQQSLPCTSPLTKPLKSMSSKRRLGMQRRNLINISKENLEKTKLLFQDLDTSFDKGASNLACSTPKRKCNDSIEYNSAFHLQTPVFDKPLIGKLDAKHLKSSIIFHEKSCEDLTETQNEIDKEYMELKNKLGILENRMAALEGQKKILENSDESYRRKRLGILSLKKMNSVERVPLQKLFQSSEENIDYFNIDSQIVSVSPWNADKLHFNISKNYQNASVICTMDGATVIPNSSNIVGVTEINNAFRAMEGVDPKLLHKHWVINHYKQIIWKLASYERKFPQYFKGCLTIENIIVHLKYRYDREIDKAERPALRRILECDDVPQKRMVLCVSNIIELYSYKYELELTDGWYTVLTEIDKPLCTQIRKRKIKVGTKLIIQGAELMNSEGCHPLDVPDNVRLKIFFNSTRRAVWHLKLGYYKYPTPFPLPLASLNPEGGVTSCVNIYVARVYPVRYYETTNGARIWRNQRAEENRRQEFDMERAQVVKSIKDKVISDYEKDYFEDKTTSSTDKKDIASITCSKTLHHLVETSMDPDSVMNSLSDAQRNGVFKYMETVNAQKHNDVTRIIAQKLKELKVSERKVSSMVKLLIMDAADGKNSKAYAFNIWQPTEEHMQLFKEQSCLTVYNIGIKPSNEFHSSNTTYFKQLTVGTSKKYQDTQRQLLPIAMTVDRLYKPRFNEFDTVGLVIRITISTYEQELWLSDYIGRLLLVRIMDGPQLCSLLHGVKRGQSVALCNLVMHNCHSRFGEAIANQFSVVSQYPQLKFLQNGLDIFKEQLPNDISRLLAECDETIEGAKYDKSVSRSDVEYLTMDVSNVTDEEYEDNGAIPSRLTKTDVAMSLLDTDQFM
ncbi:PREDICTED: breast cancer type 2 susceptibility protein homolog [Nicrophorus vespilloides]|uniref:Breast cancer type 2 susceptibility protein homolog n=1 Tax=Nicrophorus vespilloides TaxID=110193 RepID=A0ABM1NHY5_NICVS|nr:PREDICTED: breast cancer type 2 susceptibility protein homolog [Nicrophorus vespilloides]XP_017786435.1 PREDICTED: breast cancer type 2 susceptibility protein homolog [Nicrophorus vespilloides]